MTRFIVFMYVKFIVFHIFIFYFLYSFIYSYIFFILLIILIVNLLSLSKKKKVKDKAIRFLVSTYTTLPM